MGTSNPIVLFYGVVFGQIRQAQIKYIFFTHENNGVSTTTVFKENQNAPRPSEHPPVRGKKCQNV